MLEVGSESKQNNFKLCSKGEFGDAAAQAGSLSCVPVRGHSPSTHERSKQSRDLPRLALCCTCTKI